MQFGSHLDNNYYHNILDEPPQIGTYIDVYSFMPFLMMTVIPDNATADPREYLSMPSVPVPGGIALDFIPLGQVNNRLIKILNEYDIVILKTIKDVEHEPEPHQLVIVSKRIYKGFIVSSRRIRPTFITAPEPGTSFNSQICRIINTNSQLMHYQDTYLVLVLISITEMQRRCLQIIRMLCLPALSLSPMLKDKKCNTLFNIQLFRR